jgi:CO/xanthine dehydrogenase FAD-binding subunit
MRGYQYHRPGSLVEAFRLAGANPGARFIAGGTDLMVRIRQRLLQPHALISLRGVPELRGIQLGELGVRVGAGTTISEILEHRALREAWPVLGQAARRMGSTQIRNAATLGGNLCNASPCADMAGPLLVLEATLRLQGARGTREVPIHGFFVGPGATCMRPGELLSDVLVPPRLPGERSLFVKKGRVRMDLALCSVTVRVQLEGSTCKLARLAAGSVGPVPLRLRAAEACLEGKALGEAAIEAAAEAAMREVTPISDVRASADYRRAIVGAYLRRALRELSARDGRSS